MKRPNVRDYPAALLEILNKYDAVPYYNNGEEMPSTDELCSWLASLDEPPDQADMDLARELHAALCEGLPLDPLDPAAQALAILTALEAWCDRAPGRGFSATRSEKQSYHVVLIAGGDYARRASRGETLADALAQIAQVAALESEEESRG